MKKEFIIYCENINVLDDNNIYKKYYDLVSLDRKNKIDEYKNEKDKKLSLLSEVLLRKGLSDFLGLNNINNIEYEYNKYGKPYLKNSKNIYFNISHSKDYVLVVLSDKEIGCDIEIVRNNNINIAKRFFTKEEYNIITASSSEKENLDLFFRLWTAKEAYIKCIGLGLTYPLNQFNIKLIDDKMIVEDSNNANSYSFHELSIVDGYKATVCEKYK